MDNRELAVYYLKEIHNCRPKRGIEVNEGQEGMKFILAFLHFNKNIEVTAGVLACELNVSTARIAVLLKKLEEKKYITRSTSTSDARKTIVTLTELGDNKTVENIELGIKKMERLIEYMGEEEMNSFISSLAKITNYLNQDGGFENNV